MCNVFTLITALLFTRHTKYSPFSVLCVWMNNSGINLSRGNPLNHYNMQHVKHGTRLKALYGDIQEIHSPNRCVDCHVHVFRGYSNSKYYFCNN